MQSASELTGVGVDLISWSRAERFLTEHSFGFLKRLLTPAEQAAYQKASSPLHFFARCFTAKEAYFKACGGSGMGEEGFRNIETSIGKDNRFRILRDDARAEGNFFETSDGLGAGVTVWKERGN